MADAVITREMKPQPKMITIDELSYHFRTIFMRHKRLFDQKLNMHNIGSILYVYDMLSNLCITKLE